MGTYLLKNNNKFKLILFIFYIIFLFIVLIFNNIKNNYEFILLIIFLIYITFLFFNLIFLVKDLLSPLSIFIFFLLLYELPKYPFYLSLINLNNLPNITHLFSHGFIQDDLIFSNILYLIYSMIALSIYIIGFLSVKYKKYKTSKYYFKPKSFLKLYIFFLLIAIIILFIYTHEHSIFFILSRRAGAEEAKEVIAGKYYVILLASIHLFLLPIIYSLKVIKNSIIFIMLSFISFSIIYLLTGSRGLIIYTILSFVGITLIEKQKITFKLQFFIILAFIIFSIFGILRTINLTEAISINEISKIIKEKQSKYNALSLYQLQMRDEMIFEHMKDVEYGFGSSYLAIPLNVIPRVLLGELKPDMIDGKVAHQFWNLTNVGLPLNSTTESYYNFGILGLLIFYFFGKFSKYVYLKILEEPIYIKALYFFLILNANNLSSTKLIYVFHYIIVFYLIFLFLKLWGGKNVNYY